MTGLHLETRRNLFHLVLGIVVTAGIYLDLLDVWRVLAIIVAGFAISVACRKKTLPFFDWFLVRFEREENIRTMPGRGALFFFLGILIVMVLFPKDVVLASATIVVIADSVSPLIGVRMGTIQHPLSEKKFIEGSIAGFIAAFMGAMLFVPLFEAVVASALAMTVEAIDTLKGRRIEDNITMPLVAGIAIMAMRFLF